MSIAKRHWLSWGIILVLGLTGLLLYNLQHTRSLQTTATRIVTRPLTTGEAPATFGYAPLNIKMMTDNSKMLLAGNPEGASVADVAPTINFGVLNIDAQKYGVDYGIWGNVVLGPDGNYYYGLGDHSTETGGHNGALLMKYDPVTKQSQILLFSKDIFGPGGEGKWHCRMDIDPATGDMYFIGFYNGHIVYYNIYTHQAKDLGAPAPGNGWPEGTWDWQHNRYYGVGNGKGDFLVYNTQQRKTLYTGLPVDSATGKTFQWSSRARLLDRTTGNVYGTDPAGQITEYNPTTSKFTLMKAKLPAELRAWTNQKNADGSFWIFDTKGDMFKFYPAQDRVQYLGKNWGNGVYTASIERSPDGKYLYYSISDSGSGNDAGQPVIQYNTQTNQKKAIAFLDPFYAHAHNYASGKIYGVALSADGSSLFAVSNGNVVNGPRYPAIYNIAIPASER